MTIRPWGRIGRRVAGVLALSIASLSCAISAVAQQTQGQRGEYLARAGDCISCHTAQGGEPYAGGLRLDTPFGYMLSSNITPDPETGIGRWSSADFYRAMHDGVNKSGKDMYPAMPKIVQFGNRDAQVRACGSCHLPTGTGHDESAYVAGLPVAYFIRQMADWKNGDRKFGGIMIALAKAATEAEIKDAASYFASVKPRPWIRLAEAETVPKSFIGPGNKRLVHPAGDTEPMGNRIIEVPENEEDVVYRDPRSGFVAYVPPGSIAKGEALVTTGGGKTMPCATCHGRALQGLGDVPGIAGHHPNYIVRQLWNMQNGDRAGATAVLLMEPVVEKLSNDDMLAIAAYVASRKP